jgi:hypothetical protein
MSDGKILSAASFDDFLADYDTATPQHAIEPGNYSEQDNDNDYDDYQPEFSRPTERSFQQQDASGVYFDPNIHVTDNNGQPRITKNGNFRKRKGAAKNPDQFGPNINIPGKTTVQFDAPSPLAQTAALAYIQAGIVLFGDEWEPVPERREQEFLTDAWHKFFQAHDMDDLPPGLALAVACVAYAAPRLHRPNTQSRLKQFGAWFQWRAASLYYRIRYGTRFNNRPDNVRKNDTGAATDQGSKKPWNPFARLRPA